MNLIEALEVVNRPVTHNGSRFRVFLASAFTPLHFRTFLLAELRIAMPSSAIEIETGLFGDLVGNLERLSYEDFDVVVSPIEWSDLDPRLGIRSLGGWRNEDLAEIVDSARTHAARLQDVLVKLAERVLVVISCPTLPLPPLFPGRTTESDPHELDLRALVASLAAVVARQRRSRVISEQALAENSAMNGRFDAASELGQGFPYSVRHASILARHVCAAARSIAPKKGLITDLDDTLWAGILGEVGPGEIAWSPDRNAAHHGVYQQFLQSLASIGVLVAVASKNDLPVVERAFAREDLLLSKQSVFPLEAGWSAKSESVRRILTAWNVSPDSVIFVDDSPLELAEVREAFPEIECVLFPKADVRALWDLMRHLRDLFGKHSVTETDRLRVDSVRNAHAVRPSAGPGPGLDDFLERAQGVLSVTCGNDVDDRALELVNKTNQFNINGRRLTDGALRTYLRQPNAFLMTASYRDKFGPLGKICALMGRTDGARLYVDSWVLSCRAFSRRIEHHCLEYLFDRFAVTEMVFDYHETVRNHLVPSFFAEAGALSEACGVVIPRSAFGRRAPRLVHKVDKQ